MRKKVVDAIDLQIINALQKDSNVTNLSLSEEIGLSPAPTLKRVQNLVKRGIVKGYKAQVDLNFFKIKRCLTIIEVLDHHEEPLRHSLVGSPNVTSLVSFYPETNFRNVKMFCFYLICTPKENYKTLLDSIIKDIEGIVEVHVLKDVTYLKDDTYLLNMPV